MLFTGKKRPLTAWRAQTKPIKICPNSKDILENELLSYRHSKFQLNLNYAFSTVLSTKLKLKLMQTTKNCRNNVHKFVLQENPYLIFSFRNCNSRFHSQCKYNKIVPRFLYEMPVPDN